MIIIQKTDLKRKRENTPGCWDIPSHPLGLGPHEPEVLGGGAALHGLLQQGLERLPSAVGPLKVGCPHPDGGELGEGLEGVGEHRAGALVRVLEKEINGKCDGLTDDSFPP